MNRDPIYWPGHGWIPQIAGAEDDTEPDSDDDTDGHGDDEPIRDPKAKISALESANARLHKKVKSLEKALTEAEGTQDGADVRDQLRRPRLESSFLRAVISHSEPLADIDTAWDLANVRGLLDPVKVADDGKVEGMEEALSKLLDRYPWLTDGDEAEGEPASLPPTHNSGRPPNPRANRAATAALARTGMAQRLPALRKRG